MSSQHTPILPFRRLRRRNGRIGNIFLGLCLLALHRFHHPGKPDGVINVNVIRSKRAGRPSRKCRSQSFDTTGGLRRIEQHLAMQASQGVNHQADLLQAARGNMRRVGTGGKFDEARQFAPLRRAHSFQ